MRHLLVLVPFLFSCMRPAEGDVQKPMPAEAAVPAAASAAAGQKLGPVAGVQPVEADFVLRDFRFKSGRTLPELRLHYTVLGTPQRDASGRVTNAVLILHGTGGSGHQFLLPQFANEMYGPGQPLDIQRYYIILPDNIGHGGSSKPSNGLRTGFPEYVYDDMVAAQHALMTGLGVDHLRLIMGTSMGGMHSWMWAQTWPSMMDAVVPMACLPGPIVGRNRQWRKMLIDGIRQDPEWKGGEYTAPPAAAMRLAGNLLALAFSSPIYDQKRMPTQEAADKVVAESRPPAIDTNDLLYAVSASWDYDASAGLEKITAPVLHINTADDFINPPELAIAEREIKRVKNGRFILIPGSEDTRGHTTYNWAALWKHYLVELLAATDR